LAGKRRRSSEPYSGNVTLENLPLLSEFKAQLAIEKSYMTISEEFEFGFVKTPFLEMPT
jgi:hypothetical protein